MRVIDGMHRLRAARLRGDLTVEVQFFDGSEDEAFLAAVKANVMHGLPLTLADREAAAQRLLRSDSRRSDRLIADVTGLASGTIAALRRRAAGTEEATARVGRDGRVRPLNIAEGRLRAQQKIASNPNASLREIARDAGISLATASDVRRRMSRGENPVPQNKHIARARPQLAASGNGKKPEEHNPDIGSLLAPLRKDPALRYSDPGRTLLRCIEFHARGPQAIQSLVSVVPPHCRFTLARVIRRCADEWCSLARTFERSLSGEPGEQAAARPPR
jgi:ParB-like chromosome segregation protein Spo0J